MDLDLGRVNSQYGQDPDQLVEWALGLNRRAIIATNFGPFSAAPLHLVTRHRPNIPVVWVDAGYATAATYRFADEVTQRLGLNLLIYRPRRSRAHREAVDGPAPTLDDPRHAEFTREVKLEPFDRALRELGTEVWFTGVRRDQTSHRAGLEPASRNAQGVIKVAPVLSWSSFQLHTYLKAHGLPNNFDYYDPTKVESNRECGLHLAH